MSPQQGCPTAYLALVHYPVYNRRREKVATAITNLDIHDLARLGRTYGLRRVFAVTPVQAQRALVARIVSHWVNGEGGERNPIRREALCRVAPATDLDEVVTRVRDEVGAEPLVVATGARFGEGVVSPGAACERALETQRPLVVIFGTGWGLHEELVARCDMKLEPVLGVEDDYNHLAVRSAVAILLDRLFGDR